MTGQDQEVHADRIGDKDLPFKTCESCGESGDLYVVDGDVLCEECVGEESDG